MKLNRFGIVTNIILYIFEILCCDPLGKQVYMVTEHPRVTYYDRNYVRYANLTSQRYGRGDPMYYVGLHLDLLFSVGNNVTVDFYIYELLTNVYKRSFVEMHFKLCDLLQKDTFFGTALRKNLRPDQTCPYSPGVYNFYNMSIPLSVIPRSFPFVKGRIYANVSSTETGELLGTGHINMELKRCRRTKT